MNDAETTTPNAMSLLSRRRFVGMAAAAATGVVATGTGLVGGQPALAAPSQDVTSWINQHAAPLRTVEPDAGPSFDLWPLRKVVGNARIVGLGYGAHGTHTETTLHHRVIKFLVQHMGFRTVTWEESWGAGVLIDKYVVDGGGDPQAARDIIAESFPIIRHEAVVDIVRWLSEFNVNRPAHDKVRFLGNDSLEVRQFLYDQVVQYVTDVAPDRLGELNANLDPLRMHGGPQETIIWYLDPNRTEEWRDGLVAQAKAMFALVAGLPDAPSSVLYLDAVQAAETILGFYDFLSWKGVLADSREKYIRSFTNRWMQRVPNKMVYLAHNGHIGANPKMLMSIPPMDIDRLRALSGGYLREDYGRDYVAIGTSFDHGEIYVGWQSEEGPKDTIIAPAHESFVDHTLAQARSSAYLLDLNACGPQPTAVKQWLNGSTKLRFVASPYDPANDAAYKMVNDPLRVGFDALFFVREVTTARMFA